MQLPNSSKWDDAGREPIQSWEICFDKVFTCCYSVLFLSAFSSIEWRLYLPSIMLSMFEESRFDSGIWFDEWKISRRMKEKTSTLYFRTSWMTIEKGFDLNSTFFFSIALLFAVGDNIFLSDILSMCHFSLFFHRLKYIKRHRRQRKKGCCHSSDGGVSICIKFLSTQVVTFPSRNFLAKHHLLDKHRNYHARKIISSYSFICFFFSLEK